ncbi:hypothetical protein CLU79DRAFT_720702 [Phycomyces nitens]|nr:hypothetical protein CLU79DRAFT_720702 [Phycomyces nitens]
MSVKLQYFQSPDKHIVPENIQNDSTMADLDLLHQVLNNDAFPAMSFLNSTTNPSTNTSINPNTNININNNNNIIKTSTADISTHSIHANEFMDFSISLPGFSYPTNLTTSSPIPPIPLAASSAPKRSSNGKRIRYSKNKRLAHNVLRMARQQGISHENNQDILHTGDAILQGLDVAGSASGQRIDKNSFGTHTNVELKDILSQQQGRVANISPPLSAHQFPLYDLDDMAKFLSEMPMPADVNIPKPCLESAVVEKTATAPSQVTNAITVKNRKDDTVNMSGSATPTRKKKISAKERKKEESEQSLPRSPPNAGSPNTHASPPSTAAPKRRPMFVLASSYLTNYK